MGLSEQVLIALWHSSERADELAARNGVNTGELIRAWRVLKACGKLPQGDRPRSRSAMRFNAQGDTRDYRAVDNGDMLEALKRAHPEMWEKLKGD